MIRQVLDTHLYVEALRSREGFEALHDYYAQARGPIYMSAVVAQELMAGARDGESGPVEASLIEDFMATDRLVTPTSVAWRRSGEAIAALHRRKRIDRDSVTKPFANDVLIAASCSEEDVILVTRNTRDFRLIAEEIPFQFIEPRP